MRKVSLLSLVLIISSLSVLAQDKGKTRTGFRAGVNYFAQRIEENKEYSYSDFRTGLTVGIFHEIPLGTRFTFQPELVFNNMGGEKNGTVTKLNYMSLPLLLKLHGKRFGAYIGPQFSLLMSAKTKAEFDVETDVKDTYKSGDVAGITGVEYSLGANNSFVISFRYQFAINDVLKDGNPGEAIRNTGVQLTAGFRF